MTSLLEVPAVRQQVHLLSVKDYHRLGNLGVFDEKVELLRGLVVTKMAKSPLHELVAQKLLNVLIAKVPSSFQVRPERPLTLRDSEPEPDFSVVQGKPDDWATAHPSTAHLVVEVSVTSLAVDQSKAEIYAEAGVKEYWLLRPEDRAVDVFRQPTPEGYLWKATFRESDTLRCESIPAIEFRLAEVLP